MKLKKLLKYLFSPKVTIVFKNGVIIRLRNFNKNVIYNNSEIVFYYIVEWHEPWPKIL